MKSEKKLSRKTIKIVFSIILLALFVAVVYGCDWYNIMKSAGIYAPIGNGMNVIFIDVGKADSALINADGYNILIDAGIKRNGEEITTVLDRHKIDKLDMVIASHSDTDHIGGMTTILNKYSVDNFVTFGVAKEYETSSEVYNSMLEIIESKNIKFTYSKAGDSYTFGKIKLDVLSPDHEYKDVNDDSLIVKASYGESDFLFTGDASDKVEEYLLESNVDLDCDVLKVSHHGSKSGTSEEFLDAVSPSVAIVSVGENTNNLPNVETINRLKAYKGLELYRTDYNGNITVNTDGEKITVYTEK